MHWKYLALAALLAGTTSACGADNGLIGSWKQSGGDPGGCSTRLVFTGDTQTVTLNGQDIKTRVTYSASPKSVTVIGNAGYVEYDILDANHIKLHSWANCAWTRA